MLLLFFKHERKRRETLSQDRASTRQACRKGGLSSLRRLRFFFFIFFVFNCASKFPSRLLRNLADVCSFTKVRSVTLVYCSVYVGLLSTVRRVRFINDAAYRGGTLTSSTKLFRLDYNSSLVGLVHFTVLKHVSKNEIQQSYIKQEK